MLPGATLALLLFLAFLGEVLLANYICSLRNHFSQNSPSPPLVYWGFLRRRNPVPQLRLFSLRLLSEVLRLADKAPPFDLQRDCPDDFTPFLPKGSSEKLP